MLQMQLMTLSFYLEMKYLNHNVDKEALIDKFKTCNYDDSDIIKLYDLSDSN